jgi:hypothetical protein
MSKKAPKHGGDLAGTQEKKEKKEKEHNNCNSRTRTVRYT